MEEARIIKAISETMPCGKCPYPCKAKEKSSQANCVRHWGDILSHINPNADWKEIIYEADEMILSTSK